MERLRNLRKNLGKTQDDVATYLKINRTTYTKYETGDREPDFETLKKLAEYFRTTTSYLLGETDDPTPFYLRKKTSDSNVTFDDFTYAMHNEGKALTDAEKEMLLDMARVFKAKRREQRRNGHVNGTV